MSYWMGYGKCKCKKYRSCRCQTDYGSRKVTGIEYMHGGYGRCGCSDKRTCRCVPKHEKMKGNHYGSCGCSGYRTCRCLPPRGMIPQEAMNGKIADYGGCGCANYRTCRCLPRQNGKWAPQHTYLPNNQTRFPKYREGFRGNAKPLANAEHGGLGWFGQYVYTKPIPAGTGADQKVPSGLWKTFGHVVPPFGLKTVQYPIQGKVILPGRLYKYRVLVGNQFYDVQQIYKLIDGDVIDILGFYNPVVRWRVRTTNNFWDHNIIKLEEKAYS